VRTGLEGDRRLPTRLTRCCFTAAVRSHPRRGCCPRGGSEAPRSGRELWRGRSPGEQRPPSRGNPGRARTDSQGEQSFEAGEASGTGGDRPQPRGTRRRASARGKGAHSRRGIQAITPRAWASGKPEAKGCGDERSSTPVDDRRGASGLERGTRSL